MSQFTMAGIGPLIATAIAATVGAAARVKVAGSATGIDARTAVSTRGTDPPYGQIVKTDDDLWKSIARIRSVNPDSLKPPTVYPPWPG